MIVRAGSTMVGALLLGLLYPLAFAAPVAGQVTVLEPGRAADEDAPRVPSESFLTLSGQRSAVRFLPGGLDRAHHVLTRVELVARELGRWSEVPLPAAIFLVDRKQWQEAGLPGLYELPLRMSPTSIVHSVSGDAASVARWRDWLGVESLPMVFGVPTVGTAEEAATLALADVLLQIEVARALPILAGFSSREPWMSDLIAHTAALVVFRQFERQRSAEISDVFRRLRSRLASPGENLSTYDPSDRFGTVGETERWLWYQAVLFEGAEIMVDRDGKNAINQIGKLILKQRGGLTTTSLSVRYPRLEAWLGRYAPAAAGGG
jgi:hypothetical protein